MSSTNSQGGEDAGDGGRGQRPAVPGELCTCGRQAVTVFLGGGRGPTGYCGLPDGGERPDGGTCLFCGDTVDHDHYGRAETAAGRDGVAYGGDAAQSGRCPLYRLRLADPPPELHEGSVRRFDRAADRDQRSGRRLANELGDFFEELGMPAAEIDVAVEQVTEAVAGVVAVTGRSDPQGVRVVQVMLDELAAEFADLAITPNPADVEVADLLADLRVPWATTPAAERPLLVLRHIRSAFTDPRPA